MSRLDDVSQVRRAERHVCVLLDKQHRDAVAVDGFDYLKYVAHDERCESQRWFVHHDEPRAAHQCTTHGKHLLLAAGKRSRKLPTALAEPRKQRIHVLDVIREAVVAQVRPDAQVLKHGEVGENAASLRHERDALGDYPVRRQPGELVAAEFYAARLWPHYARHRAKDGRFSRAVGADEGHYLSLLNVNGDAAHRADAAEVYHEVAYFKYVTHRLPPLSTRR